MKELPVIMYDITKQCKDIKTISDKLKIEGTRINLLNPLC